jgi:hypothetical protein
VVFWNSFKAGMAVVIGGSSGLAQREMLSASAPRAASSRSASWEGFN